jgi:hypothetical protein
MHNAVLLSRLLVFGLILIVAAGALWLPARVEVRVEGDRLVVRPRGLDVLWCIRRRVIIPLASVAMVRVVARHEAPQPQPRRRGSAVPGIMVAGSYGTGDDRTFWDVRRAPRVLLISCRLGSEYKALVLEVPDPDAVAQRLNASLVAR